MPSFSIAPNVLFHSLWTHRALLMMLVKQEVVGRYRGSMLGLAWSLVNPLVLLATYTFVFGVVFKARWGTGGDSKVEFALALFIGLLIFNLFSECINRAPLLITSNMNYVKKVIFPLEILPWVTFFCALFHFTVGLVIWLLFFTVVHGLPHWSALLLIVVLLPLALFTVGICYFLATLGACLRDISQVTGLCTTLLLFLSPVFYSVSVLPETYRTLVSLNPLTVLIEQARAVLLEGHFSDPVSLLLAPFIGMLTLWGGFICFQKLRRVFADVL